MSLTVDTSLFTAMCRELAARTGTPPDTALREEVGRVLSKAIDNTPAAEASKIRQHQERAKFTLQPATIYSPRSPGRRHLKGDRVLYNLSYHYPNTLWSAIQKARAVDVGRRLAARGLAKQSWLRIAQLLGLSVDAPEYVKTAHVARDYSEDEKANVLHSEAGIAYEIENAQPTVNVIGGEQALQKAIDGRVEYFITNVEHDVFSSLGAIAKKYPGVTVDG